MNDDLHTRDGDDLEAFFAAAKTDVPPLRINLVNAILADAADQSHSRNMAEKVQPQPRSRPRTVLSSLFAGFGGWPATSALALCGVLGFVAGVSGGGDAAQLLYWGDTASIESSPDAIVDFIDISLAEG